MSTRRTTAVPRGDRARSPIDRDRDRTPRDGDRDRSGCATHQWGDGVVWSLPHGGDLDANLVRLGPDAAIGEHRNDEVDVLIYVQSGSGELRGTGRSSTLSGQTRRAHSTWQPTLHPSGEPRSHLSEHPPPSRRTDAQATAERRFDPVVPRHHKRRRSDASRSLGTDPSMSRSGSRRCNESGGPHPGSASPYDSSAASWKPPLPKV